MSAVWRAGAVGAALILVGAGCAGTVLDRAKTEDTAKADIERATGRKVASVDCPSDVEVKKGKTFECVVVFKDGKREVETLKIRNEDADLSVIDLRPQR